MRRRISTKRPEIGRFDQSVFAVVWTRTSQPRPRSSAVTSGVPSASRAHVLRLIYPRFGENLTTDADVSRRRQFGEGAGFLERKQPGGFRPGHCAAENASAAPQPDRDQFIAAAGEFRSGEAQRHAAVRHPFFQGPSVGFQNLADVGEHDYGNLPLEQFRDAPAARLGERAKRALQVVDRGKQRLLGFRRVAGHDAHRPAAPSFVHQEHFARIAAAFDFESPDLVAKLRRQRHPDRRGPCVFGEPGVLAGDQPSILRHGPQPDPGCGRRRHPGDGNGKRLAFHDRRSNQPRPRRGRLFDHRQVAEGLQKFRQFLRRLVAAEAVGDPECMGRSVRTDRARCRKRLRSVHRPGFRRQVCGQGLRLRRAHQTADVDGRIGRFGRRRHEMNRPVLAFRPVQEFVDLALASGPIRRRRPAVVDDENDRPGSVEPDARIQQRMGKSENDERGDEDAEENEPPRRRRRRFLFGAKRQEEAQRREADEAGRGRGDAEQPPQDRQSGQRREHPRRGEDEPADFQHLHALHLR